MSEKAKAPIVLIILFLMLVIALALAGVTYVNLQKETVKSAALQEELTNTKEAQKILESKMDEAKKTIQGLETKLKDNLTQIMSLGKDLQQEKSRKEDALNQVDRLKMDLQQQQSLRSDLENKFTRAQEEAKRMQAELSALEGKKAELEVKIKELEDSRNLMRELFTKIGQNIISGQKLEALLVLIAQSLRKVLKSESSFIALYSKSLQ